MRGGPGRGVGAQRPLYAARGPHARTDGARAPNGVVRHVAVGVEAVLVGLGSGDGREDGQVCGRCHARVGQGAAGTRVVAVQQRACVICARVKREF